VKEYSDKEIIECLRNRQSYVVHWLSDRYLPMIRLMVYQMGGNADDARDIFQDGLIIMLEKLDNKEFALTCKFNSRLSFIASANIFGKLSSINGSLLQIILTEDKSLRATVITQTRSTISFMRRSSVRFLKPLTP